MCVGVCVYVCVVCMCACVLQMCAYAELCATCVCAVCVCAKEEETKLTCFEVCVLIHHSVRMHVWGVHVYICNAETSLSS